MNVWRVCVLGSLVLCQVVRAEVDFSIKRIQGDANSQVMITWPAVTNKTYHIQFAAAPGGPWVDFQDGQLTAGTNDAELAYTDRTTGIAQRFYRVKTDRRRLVMVLVLDRSGSMSANGGGNALAPAVSFFVSFFSDDDDDVGMVSFATTARVDVPAGKHFKTAISNALTNLSFNGGTFAQGGLTNALAQIQGRPSLPGESPLKVVVYFTDGGANIIQDTLNCGGTPTLRNFGGYETGNYVGFFDPTNGLELCFSPGGALSCCPGVSTFTSAIDGQSKSFTRANVTADAGFRAGLLARELRAQGTTVYSIGLGNDVNLALLRQIANDPASPTFDPGQPTGQAVLAPTAQDLQMVFQQIASQITTNFP